MATKTTGDNVKVLNMVRALAGEIYQSRIPEAVDTNWAEIGNTIMSADYALEFNTFLETMFNKIGKTFIKDAQMNNPFSHFVQGTLPVGTDIEEVFVGLTELKMFDPVVAETKVFERETNDIQVLFHREDFKGFYKVTVTRAEMKGAFARESGLASMMNKIISSMSNSWKLDSFLLTKKLFTKMEGEFAQVQVPAVTDEASGETFIKAVLQNSMDQKFPTDTFNAMKVMRMQDTSAMTLILHKDLAPIMSVDVLSKRFNKSDLDLPAKIMYVDDFGGMENTLGLLIETDWLQIWNTLDEGGSIYNPQGLYSNFFLHKHGIYSASLFHNAVAFRTTLGEFPTSVYETKRV